MSVKEYNYPGFCEIHENIKLDYTGDEYSNWYECHVCREKENREFFAFLEDNSSKVKLWPKWKGGDGLGVGCPCCKANSYVTPEFAEIVTKLLKDIEETPFLTIRKIKLDEKGRAGIKSND